MANINEVLGISTERLIIENGICYAEIEGQLIKLGTVTKLEVETKFDLKDADKWRNAYEALSAENI